MLNAKHFAPVQSRQYSLKAEREALARANVGFWERDIATNAIFWSDRAVDLLGLGDHPAPTYSDFINAIYPDDRAIATEAMSDVPRAGYDQREFEYEYRVVHPDNAIKWVFVRGGVLSDPSGKPRRVAGIILDVTERKRRDAERIAAAAITQADNCGKTSFLANMSHELRTPLNAVIGFSEVLLKGTFGALNDRQQTYIADIRDAGGHLLRIINDILDHTKATAERLEIVIEPVDVLLVAKACAAMLRELSNEQGLRIEIYCLQSCPIALVDELRLRQVFINIISNSIKFSNPGTTIKIKIVCEDECVISIQDQGIGMSPDGLKIALEPFGQVQTVSGRRHQGTGLGLPLAKNLVGLQNGQFHIESKLALGTTITMTFPIPADRAPNSINADTTGKTPPLHPLTNPPYPGGLPLNALDLQQGAQITA